MHEENLEFYFLKTVFERHSVNTLRTAEDGLGINGAQQQRHAPCYHIELYPVHHSRMRYVRAPELKYAHNRIYISK